MKTLTKEQLATVLAAHALWLSSGYAEGERADLCGANLSSANLSGADLSSADLSCADLSCADLSSANLSGADLSSANLSCANLSCADLSCADLSSANLSCANLSCADLSCADLSSANLSGANLSGAYLPHFAHCPQEGEFIAFKKLHRRVIAKLLIPADAARTSSLVGRKCRAEFAVVLELSGDTYDGNPVPSTHNPSTLYAVGETVRPDSYDPDVRIECTNGIHFFISRKEAEDY